MMKIIMKATIFEESIAEDYKNDVLDDECFCFYPLEDYVKEALYDKFFYEFEIIIPDEEIKKVTEKVQKELDKLLEK